MCCPWPLLLAERCQGIARGAMRAHERVYRGGATVGEFEERRQALIGVMGPAHEVIWGQGHGVAGPGRQVRPGGR